jgi:Zn-dependent protease/predicted transcriptional regulator
MMEKRMRLLRLLGFDVYIDWSWIIIAALVMWSLARGVFPSAYRGFAANTYWILGFLGAIGLFASILFHELCHSIVARKYGVPIRRITLFLFGGVAEMESEPPEPKVELLMAAAGPAASLLLGAALFGLFSIARSLSWPKEALAVLGYLWSINLILAGFNLVPAFPLDGGRIFRAVLWKWKGDLKWSTRIASYAGSAFGFLLMAFGFVNIFRGNTIGGMWWILIGLFLRNASLASYRSVLMLRTLRGENVAKFMKSDVQTVPAHVSLRELVEDYIYRYHFKMFPVVEDERLIGCVTTREVREVPQQQWASTIVRQKMKPCSEENTIRTEAEASEALATMKRTGNSRLMVVEDNRLMGIISLKDLMDYLSVKLELEGETVRRYR